MTKVKWLALVCVLALSIGGCTITTTPPATPSADAIQVNGAKYQSEYYQYLQYRHLANDEQKCYGQIYTALRDHGMDDNTITGADGQLCPGIRIAISDVQLNQEALSRVFEAFLHDNPQFFYLDRTYSLEGHEINGQNVYDTLVLQFTMTADQRSNASDQLETAIQIILDDLPLSTDHYDTEIYLHDRLMALCTYDDQAAEASSQEFADAYSAYGALVNGKAVCEGYAKAMQLLLHRVSIPATVVLGHSLDDGIPHMWNLVNINGAYYYLDPTWNDNDAQPTYAYFNITSDMLSRTHVIDSQLYTESCTATKDNYFVRNQTYIDSYDRDTIAEAIAGCIRDGDTVVHLQFEKGKYENALLFLKNATLTQKMVNSHLYPDKTMWDYELYTFSGQNVITIRKAK